MKGKPAPLPSTRSERNTGLFGTPYLRIHRVRELGRERQRRAHHARAPRKTPVPRGPNVPNPKGPPREVRVQRVGRSDPGPTSDGFPTDTGHCRHKNVSRRDLIIGHSSSVLAHKKGEFRFREKATWRHYKNFYQKLQHSLMWLSIYRTDRSELLYKLAAAALRGTASARTSGSTPTSPRTSGSTSTSPPHHSAREGALCPLHLGAAFVWRPAGRSTEPGLGVLGERRERSGT